MDFFLFKNCMHDCSSGCGGLNIYPRIIDMTHMRDNVVSFSFGFLAISSSVNR